MLGKGSHDLELRSLHSLHAQTRPLFIENIWKVLGMGGHNFSMCKREQGIPLSPAQGVLSREGGHGFILDGWWPWFHPGWVQIRPMKTLPSSLKFKKVTSAGQGGHDLNFHA
eukprot:scaffold57881_cov14-Tisochrysis_lutea.AAC.2